MPTKTNAPYTEHRRNIGAIVALHGSWLVSLVPWVLVAGAALAAYSLGLAVDLVGCGAFIAPQNIALFLTLKHSIAILRARSLKR